MTLKTMLCGALGSVFLLIVPASSENASAYTDLDFDRCTVLAEDTMGITMKCGGYDGLPVYFKEGDLRQSVLFGDVDPIFLDQAFESFGAFNHVNTKVEWRLDAAGRPFAAILRWFIDNPGPDGGSTPQSRGEILVVARVANTSDRTSCFVALIDAKSNRDANDLARAQADDSVNGFACGRQEPVWIGKKGQLISEATASWPDGYGQN